jgi:caa(3)-type oxidase subunit IV
MSDHAHAEHAPHTNYVKIWAILCGLLVVSVLGPMLEIRAVTMITAFGIAFVKAYLVATRFMHLNLEKKLIPYMLGTMLAIMALMVGAMSPDVMKHEGARWENTAAKESVKRGMLLHPGAHHDEHAAPAGEHGAGEHH